MKIKKIGEFGLINRIKSMIKTDTRVVKGIGDDCAVVRFRRDKYMLLTCDMLIEGVDFFQNDNPYLVGSKSIATSISDIAASGGWPAYALVSLGLPVNTQLEFVQKLYKGMDYWARKYNINIVGGDISRSDKIVINISLTGFVEKKYLVLRSGASIGDIIFVTGTLGAAIADRRRLGVIPRLEEARHLVENYKVNAMIDISDGLLQDLHHIIRESKVGALIYQKLVPLYKTEDNFLKALSRGEDFELLFTLPPREAKRLFVSDIKTYSPIGEIIDKEYGLRLIDNNYKEKTLKPVGFRHF